MAFIVSSRDWTICTISALPPLGGTGPSIPLPPLPEHPDPCIEDGSQGGQYVPDLNLKRMFLTKPEIGGILYTKARFWATADAHTVAIGLHGLMAGSGGPATNIQPLTQERKVRPRQMNCQPKSVLKYSSTVRGGEANCVMRVLYVTSPR